MTNTRVVFLVALLLTGGLTLGAGCGSDASSASSSSAASSASSASSADAPFTKADVEDACALISADMVRQATGLPDTASLEKMSVPRQSDTPNICSYSWQSSDKEASASISTIDLHEDAEGAKIWFEDQTPTLSKEEMQARLEGATEAAEEEGSVSAKDAETLQSMAEGLSDDDSGMSTVYVDVDGIGTRARVELKGSTGTSYGTFVQYKNVTFQTTAYYGPNAETVMPNASITELGAEYGAKFKKETKDRRIEMGKVLAGLVVERMKEME